MAKFSMAEITKELVSWKALPAPAETVQRHRCEAACSAPSHRPPFLAPPMQQESVGACPPGDIVLEWMQRAFDGEVVEAAVPAGPGSNSDEQHVATLQVVAPNVHTDAFGNVFTIR